MTIGNTFESYKMLFWQWGIMVAPVFSLHPGGVFLSQVGRARPAIFFKKWHRLEA
jgi:hypothetical protein